MPEITRFFGIIIRMFAEPEAPHHLPHFHVYHIAVYTIAGIELISGFLPKRQQRLAEAWAELHQDELLENWERLQAGKLPYKIAPLR